MNPLRYLTRYGSLRRRVTNEAADAAYEDGYAVGKKVGCFKGCALGVFLGAVTACLAIAFGVFGVG